MKFLILGILCFSLVRVDQSVATHLNESTLTIERGGFIMSTKREDTVVALTVVDNIVTAVSVAWADTDWSLYGLEIVNGLASGYILAPDGVWLDWIYDIVTETFSAPPEDPLTEEEIEEERVRDIINEQNVLYNSVVEPLFLLIPSADDIEGILRENARLQHLQHLDDASDLFMQEEDLYNQIVEAFDFMHEVDIQTEKAIEEGTLFEDILWPARK